MKLSMTQEQFELTQKIMTVVMTAFVIYALVFMGWD